jgi:signal transduction histidine kinase
MTVVTARAGPARTELVSLAERIASLRVMRLGFASIVLALAVLAPEVRGVSIAAIAVATALYVLLLALPEVITSFRRAILLPVIGGTLLIDGIYLAWVTYATGGTQSPLRFLVFVHVVAVTLLSSYRTGLKMAAWHSLLMFTAFYAQSAGLLEVRETLVSALPGRGDDFRLVAMLNVGALWVVAIGTATFSAVNERELRAQKIDLEQLSAMVSEIDRREVSSDIPGILLNKLCDVFGFTRGAVLTSPPREDELTLVAYRGPGEPPAVNPGLGPIMERAWDSREIQLVRKLDPKVDGRLAELLPGGRNIMVVPLYLDRGERLGIAVLEYPGKNDTIKRWVEAMVKQFASHAALTLHNAWLRDENRQKLEQIQQLESELLAQNLALEGLVRERTQELRQSLDDLQTVDAQRQKLLSRLVNAEEEERHRIAGDIHDGPIQQLVAAGLQLQIVRKLLSDLGQEDALDSVDDVLAALSGSVGGMRSLIFELRPFILDHEGLASALIQFAEELDPELKLKVDNRLKHEPPADTRIILYRIAQEALANVRKHAQAERVDILLEEKNGGFRVRIKDDGVGFGSPEVIHSPGHLGLSSMRERAEMAGGTCEVRSLPGAGTTVVFWLPMGPPEREVPSGPAAVHAVEAPLPSGVVAGHDVSSLESASHA